MITPIQLHLIRSIPLNSELKSQKFRKKLEKGVLFRGAENLENFEKNWKRGGEGFTASYSAFGYDFGSYFSSEI